MSIGSGEYAGLYWAAYDLFTAAPLVVGRVGSVRIPGLVLLHSSEILLTGCDRSPLLCSAVRAGEIEARSKVGEGTVRSIEGDSEVTVAAGGPGGENSSCDVPNLR